MEAAEQSSPLQRALTSRTLTIFVIGDVLGAGIYALVGEVGAETGGAIWTAFTAAFVLALLTAFAYAELVTKYPQAAGSALYVDRAYRTPFFTFMVAFAVMSSGIASAATLARAFAGDYFSEFVDVPLDPRRARVHPGGGGDQPARHRGVREGQRRAHRRGGARPGC